MPQTPSDLANLHAALLRAQAMGFEQTARAMQKVIEEISYGSNGLAGLSERRVSEEEGVQ